MRLFNPSTSYPNEITSGLNVVKVQILEIGCKYDNGPICLTDMKNIYKSVRKNLDPNGQKGTEEIKIK